MSNPALDLLTVGGDADKIDPIIDADGVIYLKAAGDSLGVPTNAADPRSPQLVQLAGGHQHQFAATPTNLVLVQGTGTLGAATYYYRVSAITPAGETLACAEVSLAISATHGVDLSWAEVSGATGYRVYGRSTGAELLIATVAAPTLTYTDSGSITPAGALPTISTARFAETVDQAKAAVAPSTRVSSSASSVTLLTANTQRKGVAIYNESTQVLYVRLAAAAASATAYWLQMAANSYAEVPFGYTGEIRGIWASANGAAMVTEGV